MYDEDSYQGLNIGIGTDAPDVSLAVVGDVCASRFFGLHFGNILSDISSTDPSFVDVSASQFYGLHIGDISGTDAKFIDVEVHHNSMVYILVMLLEIYLVLTQSLWMLTAQLYGLHIGNVVGDISGTDAKFVDVSAAQVYGLHIGNVVGDVTGNVVGDISGMTQTVCGCKCKQVYGLHN